MLKVGSGLTRLVRAQQS